ncbi:MAG: M56 family metallopeptidase, partial [Prevotella sp.]|nr:M56 family metallopeptidase [Prevotella sp.]
MDNVIVLYLIKASVSLALFYGLYMLCLRTDTFFRLRRGYFLFAIFFSLLYPILILEMPVKEAAPIQMPTYWLSQIDVVAANAEPPAPVVNVWLVILEGLALVSLLYAIKFIIQLFSVVKLRADNKSEKLATCRIIKMKNKETSPFSFFNWIFINIENHTGKELDEIIAHEQIHGRQYHSIDVILAELLCICFWWNPFAWLLKKEMKINLEYLADEGVLKAGFDTAEYQYILLQITNKNTGIPLINNFNVSQLKKRIIMMNKRKTSLGKAVKYLLAVPVVFALLLGNAVQASPDIIDIPFMDGKQVPQKKGDVYTVAEQMPSFAGGEAEMQKFLGNNVKYPVAAQAAGIQGRVVVRFIVGATGEISDVRAIRGVDPELDKEAVRVIKAMPKWKPGKQGGKAVDVYYTLPIVFRLTGNKDKITTKEENAKNVIGYGSAKNGEETNIPADGSKPFITVEQMPSFPGGEAEMQRF